MTEKKFVKKSEWLEAVAKHFPGEALITNKIDKSEHILCGGYLAAAWFDVGYGKVWPGYSKMFFKVAA